MSVYLTVLSVFLLAIVIPWLNPARRKPARWGLAALPLILYVYFMILRTRTAEGEIIRWSLDWAPGLGVHLSSYVDGLSVVFTILITFIGFLVVLYAGSYLEKEPRLNRFYVYLFLFMGSMLGLVVTDNLLVLFVFWELTSVSSYLLIGFNDESESARAAAWQALLTTGMGGLALMAGLLLLGQMGGSFEFSVLLERGEAIRSHPHYLFALILILLGAFTKSAQFPFHYWLPGAMEAPTPVSAYLHSATMVKAGVFLLARLSPILGYTPEWHYIVSLTGAVTMLFGAAMALPQTDLKKLLAYSTVSSLGMLVLLLGLDTVQATKAAMVFLVVHSLYKGALFMVAGAVDHEAGTRDITRLGGLFRLMPVTAAACFLAAASMSGFPPLIGFISKELLYEAKLQAPQAGIFITFLGLIGNVLMVAAAALVCVRTFFGKRGDPPKEPHEAPWPMWLGPVVLSGLGLVMCLFCERFSHFILSPAVSAVRAEPIRVEIALWHGMNPVFGLSVLTYILGIVVFAGSGIIRRASSKLHVLAEYGPVRWYQWCLDGMLWIARRQTRILQSGYLRFYILIIVLWVLGTTGYVLFKNRVPLIPEDGLGVTFFELVLAGLVVSAAVACVKFKSRLGSALALGVVGYGVALLFIRFGAPDLAMTQFMIETLTVLLIVLVFYKLPRYGKLSPRGARLRDLVTALGVGALMTILVLTALGTTHSRHLSDYFAKTSKAIAHGANVVNVILVDFRALDTLGEITVLTLAGIGVIVLLRLSLGGREKP